MREYVEKHSTGRTLKELLAQPKSKVGWLMLPWGAHMFVDARWQGVQEGPVPVHYSCVPLSETCGCRTVPAYRSSLMAQHPPLPSTGALACARIVHSRACW